MKKIMKIFNEYTKEFDLKNPHIMGKFHHSYRVMEYAKEIAESLDLSEDDIKLASIIGLFHDIGRFNQWTKYETYEDSKSIDHGDYGADIIKDFIDDITSNEEEQKIIMVSIKNHNKYQIEDNLTQREMLFCKIIRDADKLDIMREQGIIQENYEVKQDLLDYLKNHKMVTNNLVETKMDGLIRLISFIFDFNFKYSYQFILDNNIIQNKLNLIEIYGDMKLDELEEDLTNYVKERLTC